MVAELRNLLPDPRDGDRAVFDSLWTISFDVVCKVLACIAPISGAGPWGLRPSHLQDALRRSSGDQLLHLLPEGIQLMHRGEIPVDLRPWLCRAHLWLSGSPTAPSRQVAVGEWLRGRDTHRQTMDGHLHGQPGQSSALSRSRQPFQLHFQECSAVARITHGCLVGRLPPLCQGLSLGEPQ